MFHPFFRTKTSFDQTIIALDHHWLIICAVFSILNSSLRRFVPILGQRLRSGRRIGRLRPGDPPLAGERAGEREDGSFSGQRLGLGFRVLKFARFSVFWTQIGDVPTLFLGQNSIRSNNDSTSSSLAQNLRGCQSSKPKIEMF